MKAVKIKGYGGRKVIEIDNDSSLSEIKGEKAIVDIMAAGVYPMDWKIREVILNKIFTLTLRL
jgi:NADPH:quinone reductase-like Zn-dependent oxidoreductase